ncbi:isoprenylcysteine carboxylmethyltransferase family protein [Sphingomonas koreensis]|nr:isoprenylcysteine carboxylmethyltransferase family protein [Sphingomonas koreensis]
MFTSDPVGLPGFAALSVGFVAFFLAVIAARLRRGVPDSGSQKRSGRSVLGIAIQAAAFFFVSVGNARTMLDPLSPLALGEALVIALLMAAAVALFVWASRTMGRNWSIIARTRSDHELITAGPFAYVRHPIYTALALFLVAVAIASGNAERLLIGLPLYALGTWLRIAEEERLLRDMFGAAYDGYAARVKRFVPGLF